jgi:hypothetical protein
MSNYNDRILDMYTVLINQVYLSHSRFLETVNVLEQGIREIYNNTNNNNNNNNTNNNNTNNNNTNNNNNNTNNNTPPLNRFNNRHNNTRLNNTRLNNTRLNNTRLNNTRLNNTRLNNTRLNNNVNNQNLYMNNIRNLDYLYNFNTNTLSNRIAPNLRLQEVLYQPFSNLLNQFPNNFNNLSPVIVRPSQQQIENATEQINNTETSQLICPITQETFNENTLIIRIIHCQHCFSREAIMNWFDRSVLCPVCRYDIRDFSNDSIPTDTSNNSPPFQRTTSIESNTSLDSNIENFLNIFTSQISESLSQYIINNDISLNDLDNRAINLEYTIQTPNNLFTISTLSPESIGNMIRGMNNNDVDNNNNDDNNNNNNDDNN